MIYALYHRGRGPPTQSIIASALFLSCSFVYTLPLSTTFTTVGHPGQTFHDQSSSNLTKRGFVEAAAAADLSKLGGAVSSAGVSDARAVKAANEALAPISKPAGKPSTNSELSKSLLESKPESTQKEGIVEHQIPKGSPILKPLEVEHSIPKKSPQLKPLETIAEEGEGHEGLVGFEKDAKEELPSVPEESPKLKPLEARPESKGHESLVGVKKGEKEKSALVSEESPKPKPLEAGPEGESGESLVGVKKEKEKSPHVSEESPKPKPLEARPEGEGGESLVGVEKGEKEKSALVSEESPKPKPLEARPEGEGGENLVGVEKGGATEKLPRLPGLTSSTAKDPLKPTGETGKPTALPDHGADEDEKWFDANTSFDEHSSTLDPEEGTPKPASRPKNPAPQPALQSNLKTPGQSKPGTTNQLESKPPLPADSIGSKYAGHVKAVEQLAAGVGLRLQAWDKNARLTWTRLFRKIQQPRTSQHPTNEPILEVKSGDAGAKLNSIPPSKDSAKNPANERPHEETPKPQTIEPATENHSEVRGSEAGQSSFEKHSADTSLKPSGNQLHQHGAPAKTDSEISATSKLSSPASQESPPWLSRAKIPQLFQKYLKKPKASEIPQEVKGETQGSLSTGSKYNFVQNPFRKSLSSKGGAKPSSNEKLPFLTRMTQWIKGFWRNLLFRRKAPPSTPSSSAEGNVLEHAEPAKKTMSATQGKE